MDHNGSQAEVLQHCPRFRSLLIRTGISKLGNSIAHFAVPLIILERTGSANNMALGVFFDCLPHLLFGPYLGALADRVDRRKMLICSDMAQMALTLLISAYLLVLPKTAAVWPLYLACFAGSLIDVAYWVVAEFCIVPRLVPPEMLSSANSLYFATATAAAIMGPLVGGQLLAHGRPGTVFALDSLTFLATLLLWWRMPSELFGEKPRGPQVSTWGKVKESFSLLQRHDVLVPLMVALCLSNLSNSCRQNLMVYHWKEVLSLPADQLGLRVSVFALVGILGNLVSPYLLRVATEGILFAAHWTISVVLGVVIAFGPASDGPLWFGVLWMEFLGGAVWIYTFHARQLFIPAANRAGVNAIARAGLLGAASLSALIFLPLEARFGVHTVVGLQAIPLLLAIFVWVSNYRLRGMHLAIAPARASAEPALRPAQA